MLERSGTLGEIAKKIVARYETKKKKIRWMDNICEALRFESEERRRERERDRDI